MKIGDKVEIIPAICGLQPPVFNGSSSVLHNYKQYGTVTGIDGAYILVKPKNRRWEVELYVTELRAMTKEEFKEVKNYSRGSK